MLRLFLIVSILLTERAYCATLKHWPNDNGGRIVGGTETTIYEFPWQISLRYLGQHNCGGSIITSNKILTAAHCTFRRITQFFDIRAGSSYHLTGGNVIGVNRIVNHEHYNQPTSINNDISLVFLTVPLEYGPGIQPILLPYQGELLKNDAVALVSGWGYLSEGGSMPNQLHYVAVPLVDNELCTKMPSFNGTTMLCAGNYLEGGIDSCQMDSGGPLVINGVLHGAVSWGYGCAQPGLPGVYVRVSTYRDWIDSHGN